MKWPPRNQGVLILWYVDDTLPDLQELWGRIPPAAKFYQVEKRYKLLIVWQILGVSLHKVATGQV